MKQTDPVSKVKGIGEKTAERYALATLDLEDALDADKNGYSLKILPVYD